MSGQRPPQKSTNSGSAKQPDIRPVGDGADKDIIQPTETPVPNTTVAVDTNDNDNETVTPPTPKSTARLIWDYSRAIVADHDFWLHFLTVKGGAAAAVLSVGVAATQAIALPFVAASFAVAGAGAIVGLGLYGMIAGTKRGAHSLRNLWRDVTGKPPIPEETEKKKQKSLAARFAETKTGKKITNSRLWQRVKNSHLAKYVRGISHTQDVLLSSLASGGSIVSIVTGGALLATQVAMVPVLAMGTAAVMTAVAATTSLALGVIGMRYSYNFLKESVREFAHKRQQAKLAKEAAQHTVVPVPPKKTYPDEFDSSLEAYFAPLAKKNAEKNFAEEQNNADKTPQKKRKQSHDNHKP